jgi:hypothetical protein
VVLATNSQKRNSGKVNNYWCIFNPNCRQTRKLFFSEVSVCWWSTKVCRLQQIKAESDSQFMLYLRVRSFSRRLQLLVKLRVKEVYLSCVFSTIIARWSFNGILLNSVTRGDILWPVKLPGVIKAGSPGTTLPWAQLETQELHTAFWKGYTRIWVDVTGSGSCWALGCHRHRASLWCEIWCLWNKNISAGRIATPPSSSTVRDWVATMWGKWSCPAWLKGYPGGSENHVKLGPACLHTAIRTRELPNTSKITKLTHPRCSLCT